MLKKNRRIQRSYFKKIITESKRYHSTSFVLYLSKINNNTTPSKFSFSISKKILKSAVKRNKQRRRAYSVIKNDLEKIKPGFFCFFVFKKGFHEKFSDLEKDIKGLLSSSGVLI